MFPSTNTWYGHATSIETTTLVIAPSTSSYVTQTDLDNKINVLFAKHNDKFDKLYESLEYINALIANQDVKVDKKIEN